MIPSISYPEAMAKVRVITLQDQLKRTANTLHKADTFHVAISEELNSPDCTTPEKELLTADNPSTPIKAIFSTAQTSEQADTIDDVKIIYTRRFQEFVQNGHAASKGS